MFSKQRWMDAPDCDYFSKTQYDTNLKNRTTVICFKFKTHEKPVSVMPLQIEGYQEASSNLYDQLFIKWTKDTRLLKISISAFFISFFLKSYYTFIDHSPPPHRPPPRSPTKKVLNFKSSIFSSTATTNNQKINHIHFVKKISYFHFDCVIAYQAPT